MRIHEVKYACDFDLVVFLENTIFENYAKCFGISVDEVHHINAIKRSCEYEIFRE